MSHKLCDLWTLPEGENSFLPSNRRCVKLWGSGGGGKKEEEEEEEREEMGDLLIISPLLLLLRQRSIHSTLCFMMCFLMAMLIIEQEWGCKSYTTCFMVWLNFWINFKEGFAARIIFTPPLDTTMGNWLASRAKAACGQNPLGKQTNKNSNKRKTEQI